MRETWFGNPTWIAGKNKVSRPRYTFLQGVETVVTELVRQAKKLSSMRLFLLPRVHDVQRDGYVRWVLSEQEIGDKINYDTGEKTRGFIAKVEMYDSGPEIPDDESSIWDRILCHVCNLMPANERTLIISCYTADGHYIGDLTTAAALYLKHGLSDVQPINDNRVCSIGFDAKNQQWVGWSHRAMGGFKVGHIVKEGNCEASSGWTAEYLAEHPEESIAVPVGFECKTLDDAKRCAMAFAESVS